jgi:PKHD-type hydroxylase
MNNLTCLPLRQVFYERVIELHGVFSKDECQQIISTLKDSAQTSTIDGGMINKDIRSSSSTFIQRGGEFEWIFERLWYHMRIANLEFYNFDLSCFGEGTQFAKYSPEDFYDWHQDYGPLNFSNRKLSGVVNLSSPDEYSGGELEIFNLKRPLTKEQGSIIIFPSFEQHRVNKINSGARYSLTTWISGNCFR